MPWLKKIFKLPLDKQSKEKLWTVLLIVLPFLVGLALYSLTRIEQTSAQWWNNLWLYRRAVQISNNNESTLEDFQVAFTLDTASLISNDKMKSDCADIRITNESGDLIPHWIEENGPGCNDANTKIWTKAPVVYPGASATTLFVYYGNEIAPDVQSGNDVFELFEDFESETIDWDKWQQFSPFDTAGSIGTSSTRSFQGNYSLQMVKSSSSNNMVIFHLYDNPAPQRISGRFYEEGNNQWGLFVEGEGASGIYAIGIRNGTSSTYFCTRAGTISSWSASSIQRTEGWQHFEYVADGSTTKYYINDQEVRETSAFGTISNVGIGSYWIESGGDTQYFDLIISRKYATFEPTANLTSSEEESPAGSRAIFQGEGGFGSGFGLVSYWDFNEGSGSTTNDSVSTNHGTIYGASWTTDGKFGNALSFAGSNNYVRIPHDASFDVGGGPFTVSAWVKPSSLSGRYGVFTTRVNNSAGSWQLEVGRASAGSNVNRVAVTGVNTWIFESVDNIITLGEWNHVAYVRQSNSDPGQIYVNGQAVTSRQTSSYTVQNNTSDKGIGEGTSSQTGQRFPGIIDEVKFFNQALSEADILREFNNQFFSAVMGQSPESPAGVAGSAASEYCIPGDDSSCAPPIGEWLFSENQGTTVSDSSENSNDGTLINMNNSNWTVGKNSSGSALNFDGINNYINVPYNFSAPNILTISLWFKTNSSSRGVLIGAANVEPTSNPFAWTSFLVLQANGLLRAEYWTGSYASILSDTTVNDGQWHHVAFVGSGSSQTLYVDGKLIGTISGNINNSWWNYTTIGTGYDTTIRGAPSNTWYYFDGVIDQVRLFNYALSAAQVAWDYNRGAPVGHWRLDECQGSTANDVSGNENNGAIVIGSSGSQTAVGTCDSGLSTDAWYNGRVGKWNASLSFDGVDDYVELSKALNIFNSSFTVSMWTYFNDDSRAILLGDYQRPNAISVNFEKHTDRRLRLYWDGTPDIFTSNDVVDLNKWQLVTFVRDKENSKVYIYVDSYLVHTYDGALSDKTTSGLHLLGRDNRTGTTTLDGKIDEVRIYNYALTHEQIILLYNYNKAVKF